MIKAILMLQNSMIPPHIGIKNRMNPKLPPFDTLNVRIPMRATEFKPRASNSKRRIVLNNFDAAVSFSIINTLLLTHLRLGWKYFATH
jgi:iron transport multicopper oxidase